MRKKSADLQPSPSGDGLNTCLRNKIFSIRFLSRLALLTALVSACEVSETILSSRKNLSTVEITDSVGVLIPSVISYNSEGYTEIKSLIHRPYKYRTDEEVRKISKVKGNNRLKITSMLLGAAGMTAGFTLIGQDGQANSPIPYYVIAGSALVFGSGLAGMYVDTSVYQRLSHQYYFDADTILASNAQVELQLNESEPARLQFDSAGVLRVNVFTLFNDFRKFSFSPADTLYLYYGDKRHTLPVSYFDMKVAVSNSEIPLYAQPLPGEVAVVNIEPGIYLTETEVINDQFSEIIISGVSYFTDRSLLNTVYTAPHHYVNNMPDINHLVSSFLKNSANRYLIRLDTESPEQYQNRIQRFDAQKNLWLRQSFEFYAHFIRDRMTHAKIQLLEYDSDNQLYLIEISGFGKFPVRVPRTLVSSFRESSNNLSFYNIRFTYRRETLEIEEISLFNSSLQSYFTYEDRMKRLFRNSRLWDKSQFPEFRLQREYINEFFSKSVNDFKNLEDEYNLPTVQLPYGDAAAVFVEISRFKYYQTSNMNISGIPSLKKLAIQSMGIKPEKILIENDATKADFFRLFGFEGIGSGQLLKSENQDSSLLILYIQGLFYYDSEKSKVFIIPHDGHPSFVPVTSIDLKDLISKIQKNGYNRIIALLDGPVLQSANADSLTISGIDRYTALIFSSSPGQKSYTNPRTLLTIFLHRFLKELSELEGEVTIGQIYDRLCCAPRSVPVLAREFHQAAQSPLLVGNKNILLVRPIYDPKE